MKEFSWGLNSLFVFPIIQNKIRIQTRHRAASIFLQSNQSLKTSNWILWADANPKLCPQDFRSQGSLFLPPYRGGACIFLAGLECDEGHLLWPTRALRSTAVLQPAVSWQGLQPTRSVGTPLPGLARLHYGLDWKATRDADIAWEEQLSLEIILVTRMYPILTEQIVSPLLPIDTTRTEDSQLCAVSEEVSMPQESQLVGKALQNTLSKPGISTSSKTKCSRVSYFGFQWENGQAIAKAPDRNRTSWAVADGLPLQSFNESLQQ